MKLEIFSIRDRQLDAYMQPWCAQSIGQATRMFSDEMNNKEGTMNKHPGDYDLYHLGTFLQQTGYWEPNKGGPKQIAIGSNVVEQ